MRYAIRWQRSHQSEIVAGIRHTPFFFEVSDSRLKLRVTSPDSDSIINENGGNVFGRKFIGGVADQ